MNYKNAARDMFAHIETNKFALTSLARGETCISGTDADLKNINDELRVMILDKVAQGQVDPSVLDNVVCTFGNSNTVADVPDLTHWSFVYYHGTLHDHFDSKGARGDEVSCTIDLYKFPLGMTYVSVDGMNAICYLWESPNSTLYTDSSGNSYKRANRKGLILEAGDPENAYAKTKMDDRSEHL